MVDSKPVSSAKRGRPGYDQETVLRRAIEVFNRQGYDGTSMVDIAKELGLTKSAIYHHITSKEQLLSAALDEALDELTTAIDDAVRPDPTASAYIRLQDVVYRSVRILVEHLPAVTLLLRVRGNSEVELDALKRRRVLDEKLAGLVAATVDEGQVRSDIPPDLISKLLFGLVNSLIEWYRPDGPVDIDTVAHSIASMAFDGLALHPGVSRSGSLAGPSPEQG